MAARRRGTGAVAESSHLNHNLEVEKLDLEWAFETLKLIHQWYTYSNKAINPPKDQPPALPKQATN